MSRDLPPRPRLIAVLATLAVLFILLLAFASLGDALNPEALPIRSAR